MKDLKVNKRLIAALLVTANMFCLNQDVYASEINLVEETKDLKDYVVALDNIKVYETPGGSVISNLEKGHTLKLLTEIEGNYEVLYNDKIAYVKNNDVKEVFLDDPERIVFVKNDKEIYDSVLMNESIDTLQKCEYCEVYEENDDSYLVKADDIYGYITKDNTEEIIDDKYIIIDLSSQNIKMYVNKELIVDSPVVTGKGENSRTHVGKYRIFRKRHNCYLIGPNRAWCNYVDYMLNFDDGVGIHDAEYHTHEDGTTHGWRDISEFGGTTYKNKGSHGCVNCPNKTSKDIYENAEIGTTVIVKR